MLTGNLEKIAEHGRRADNIVKSMLEHSRGGSGERRAVDLNALVDEALNLAYHGARAQDQSFNITLERDYDQALAPIELVPQDITRVFLNLFGNGFYAATKRARGMERRDVPADPEGDDARSRRCGRNPGARQRHRHPARDQRQAVPAVLHDQANRRGHGSACRSATTSSPSSMAARSRSTARSASSPSSRSGCPRQGDQRGAESGA